MEINNNTSYFLIIDIIKILAKGHISHQKLIIKISEILCKNSKKFSYCLSEIFDNYYELGANTKLLEELFTNVNDLPIRNNPETLFKMLIYWASNEKFVVNEEFEQAFNSMISSTKPFKIHRTSDLNLFYYFLTQLKITEKINHAENFRGFLKKHQYILENSLASTKLIANSLQVRFYSFNNYL